MCVCLHAVVCSINRVFTKSTTENRQPPAVASTTDKNVPENGYLDLVADEDYKVGPKTHATGYLSPIDSPGPEHSYVVVIPSPTTSDRSVEDIEQTPAAAAGSAADPPSSSPAPNAGYLTPFEDGTRVDNEHYLDMSAAGSRSSPAEDNPSSESTRNRNHLTDDDYLTPGV